MRHVLLALVLATATLPAGAQASGASPVSRNPDTDGAVCPPGDDGCARFVGDAKGALPKRKSARQPVVIGTSVYMLTAWQAERERRCLALAGWAEARGEGADAMAAVMWVVANRSASAAQPSLPCRVVVASGQFEPFAAVPEDAKTKQKPAKSAKRREKTREQPDSAERPRDEARRLLAELRRQAQVIRAGGMPSWPKPRLAPDRDALRVARGLAWNLNDDDLPDPTARASLFYSPSAQAMLRRQKPDWAEARLRTASIGEHTFYRYPPSRTDRTDTQVAQVGE